MSFDNTQAAALSLIAKIDNAVMNPSQTTDEGFAALLREGAALMALLPSDKSVVEFDTVVGYEDIPPITDGDIFVHMKWAEQRRSA